MKLKLKLFLPNSFLGQVSSRKFGCALIGNTQKQNKAFLDAETDPIKESNEAAKHILWMISVWASLGNFLRSLQSKSNAISGPTITPIVATQEWPHNQTADVATQEWPHNQTADAYDTLFILIELFYISL